MSELIMHNGARLPAQVFGTYQIPNTEVCAKAVSQALQTGYRAVDTAASYGNEAAVGEGIRASGLQRNEIFVQSKLWVQAASDDGARRSVERSLELLGLDYLDLYLIHQPVGDVYGAWRGLTKLYEEGLVKAIGVSNFAPDRLMDLAMHNDIVPMVNQIEINPFCQQSGAFATMLDLGVVPQAWAPLAEGRNGLFFHPVLRNIAAKHSVSVAQVVLAYIHELGASVVAKTMSVERLKENLAAVDIVLDAEDCAKIRSMDMNKSQFFAHTDPAIVRWFSERRLTH